MTRANNRAVFAAFLFLCSGLACTQTKRQAQAQAGRTITLTRGTIAWEASAPSGDAVAWIECDPAAGGGPAAQCRLMVWRVIDEAARQLISGPSPHLETAEWSPDGRRLLVSGGGSLAIAGLDEERLTITGAVRCQFSAAGDGGMSPVACLGSDGRVTLWDARREWRTVAEGVTSFGWAQAGLFVVKAGKAGQRVESVSLTGQQAERRLLAEGDIQVVRAAPNTAALAWSDSKDGLWVRWAGGRTAMVGSGVSDFRWAAAASVLCWTESGPSRRLSCAAPDSSPIEVATGVGEFALADQGAALAWLVPGATNRLEYALRREGWRARRIEQDVVRFEFRPGADQLYFLWNMFSSSKVENRMLLSYRVRPDGSPSIPKVGGATRSFKLDRASSALLVETRFADDSTWLSVDEPPIGVALRAGPLAAYGLLRGRTAWLYYVAGEVGDQALVLKEVLGLEV